MDMKFDYEHVNEHTLLKYQGELALVVIKEQGDKIYIQEVHDEHKNHSVRVEECEQIKLTDEFFLAFGFKKGENEICDLPQGEQKMHFDWYKKDQIVLRYALPSGGESLHGQIHYVHSLQFIYKDKTGKFLVPITEKLKNLNITNSNNTP